MNIRPCPSRIPFSVVNLFEDWKLRTFYFFTRGQYGHRVLSLPASVCPSVCQSLACPHDNLRLVQARITSLNHRCKRPWLRSLLFWGVIDLYLQGQIYLQSQNLPSFELARAITHHPFKLGLLNLDQRCKIPCLSSLFFGRLIELDMSKLTYFQYSVYLHRFASFKYLWDLQKRMKTESVPHLTWLSTYLFTHRVMSWTAEQSSCIFSATIAGFPVLDSAIGDGSLNASVGFR